MGVYILGGQSVDNVVERNVIGSTATGKRAGNGEYGVLLYNAPNNTVVRSGQNTNQITGSGIANYREFIGPAVSANSSGNQATGKSKSRQRSAKSTSPRDQVLIGRTTPAGPTRRATKAR